MFEKSKWLIIDVITAAVFLVFVFGKKDELKRGKGRSDYCQIK